MATRFVFKGLSHMVRFTYIAPVVFFFSTGVIAADSTDVCNSSDSNPIIGYIEIDVGDIFDTEKAKENNWLFRTANALHINTKESVIRKDLLFKEKQKFSPRLVSESERRLRSRKYLNRVKIETTDNCDGTVDVHVKAREVWTFKPTVSFSRAGSNNNTSIGIEDTNFMGLGKSLSLSRSSDADRSYTVFEYYDPNTGFLNSSLQLNYSSNSDGYDHGIAWQKPFESLESKWSAGVSLDRYEELNYLYDAGEQVDRYLRASREFDIFYGWRVHLSDESVHRVMVGSTSVDHGFSSDVDTLDNSIVPEHNEFFYPWVEYQYLQESYIQTSNFRQINRIEDINLGWNFRLRVGYTSSELDVLDGMYAIESEVSKSQPITDNSMIVLNSKIEGFYGDEGLTNFKNTQNLALHWQNFESGQFFINYTESKIVNPLNHEYLTLGGDEGLRGFPSNYQTGDHSRLFNIEQRFYGHKELLSLFYLGGAVFFDGGHAWGGAPVEQTQEGWLRDVGFGLRLSNTRLGGRLDGGHNVIHFDVAFPLDADRDVDMMQFLVKVKSSF